MRVASSHFAPRLSQASRQLPSLTIAGARERLRAPLSAVERTFFRERVASLLPPPNCTQSYQSYAVMPFDDLMGPTHRYPLTKTLAEVRGPFQASQLCFEQPAMWREEMDSVVGIRVLRSAALLWPAVYVRLRHIIEDVLEADEYQVADTNERSILLIDQPAGADAFNRQALDGRKLGWHEDTGVWLSAIVTLFGPGTQVAGRKPLRAGELLLFTGRARAEAYFEGANMAPGISRPVATLHAPPEDQSPRRVAIMDFDGALR